MQIEVTTTYLEMLSPTAFRPPKKRPAEFTSTRLDPPVPVLNNFFYTVVGRDWHWTDRLPWTDDQWTEFATRPGFETWIGTVKGTPVGYFELERVGTEVEIAMFGLIPQFVGRGYGGTLLAEAITRAWQGDVSRVWVHTCTADHPSALTNYKQRGFTAFKQEKGMQNTDRNHTD